MEAKREREIVGRLACDFEHSLKCNQGVSLSFRFDFNTVDRQASHDAFEYPQHISRVNSIHRGTRTNHRIKAEDFLVGILSCQPPDHADLGANTPRRSRGCSGDLLKYQFSRSVHVGGSNDFPRALGVNNDRRFRVALTCCFDLIDSEAGYEQSNAPARAKPSRG